MTRRMQIKKLIKTSTKKITEERDTVTIISALEKFHVELNYNNLNFVNRFPSKIALQSDKYSLSIFHVYLSDSPWY